MIVERRASIEDAQPFRFRSVELVGVFAAFTVATVALTLPLWVRPARTLPSDLIDTLLNTWIVGWDADRLRHGLRGLWNAPAFFPYRNTLAFSENLLGVAVFVAPVYWLTGNAVLTYNVAFTLSYALAGFGMYLLAASLTRSRACGFVGAIYYAFCPYRFVQMSHLQMIATGWLPIALFALHRYFETSRRSWLALLGISSLLQVLSNLYVAYFMALPFAAVAATVFWRERDRTRRILELAAVAAIVGVALVPIARHYYEVRAQYGQVRRLVEMNMGSADARSYVIGDRSVGMFRLFRPSGLFGELELFPGVAAIALALVAVASLRRREAEGPWIVAYGLTAVAAALLSLGPEPRVWGHLVTAHGPYDWLMRIVPGMDGMRVPARFAIIVSLGLSVLAAFGTRSIAARLAPRLRAALVPACIAVILAESWVVPMPANDYPAHGRPEDRAVAEWLKTRPAGGVLHEPVKTWNYQELSYQFATLAHQHPIVNGISGYDTPLQMLFRDGSSVLYDYDRPADVVRMLRSLGVRYLVVHIGDYNNFSYHAALALVRESGQVVHEVRFGETYAFELQPPIAPPEIGPSVRIEPKTFHLTVSQGPDRAQALVDGDLDSRWFANQDGNASIEVALAQPADIAAVDLRLADRTLGDYPLELQVDATDDRGVTRTLYRAVPYPEFISGFVANPAYPRMRIVLPSNRSSRLTIRDTGIAPGRWWSVHELELWRRP